MCVLFYHFLSRIRKMLGNLARWGSSTSLNSMDHLSSSLSYGLDTLSRRGSLDSVNKACKLISSLYISMRNERNCAMKSLENLLTAADTTIEPSQLSASGDIDISSNQQQQTSEIDSNQTDIPAAHFILSYTKELICVWFLVLGLLEFILCIISDQ